MQYKQQKQYRHKNYDYSQNGFYFITICAKNHQSFFGDIIKSGSEFCPAYEMQLSEIGKIVEQYWLEIPKHFPFINLGEFVIMPNHNHGIIEIDKVETGQCPESKRTGHCPVPTEKQCGSEFGHVTPKSLSTIIGSIKSIVTKTVNQKFSGNSFAWQSRFHDRIIRNKKELDAIRKYVSDNPAKWHLDKYNPENF